MSGKKHVVLDLKSGKARPVFSQTPILSSAGAPWNGVSLEHHPPEAVEAFDWAPMRHIIALQFKQTAAVELRCGSDGFRSASWPPGKLSVFPAMAHTSVRTPNSGEVIAVQVDPKFVLCAASDLIDAERFELVPQHIVEDPLVSAGILELKGEVEAGYPGGRCYGETVATMLAVHLVRNYATRRMTVRDAGPALPRQQLRRAVDYIHEHLADDVSLTALAAAAGLSPFHFSRLFKKSTGLAPHRYLTLRRVERARTLLMADYATIADVALQVGFCDQSHLAAHFKRIYGITPKAFIQQTAPRR